MTTLSAADRAELGMEDLEIGPAQVVVPVHDGEAKAYQEPLTALNTLAKLDLTTSASSFEKPDIEGQAIFQAGPEVATDFGLELGVVQGSAPVVVVSSLWGANLVVRSLPGPAPDLLQDDHDEGTWYLSMPFGCRVLVIREKLPVGLLAVEPGGVVLHKAWRTRTPGWAPAVEAPIEAWLEGCKDEWLCAEVRARASTGHAYQLLAAAGAFARLRREEGDEAEAHLAEILAEAADPEIARPLTWWRGLGEEVRDWLESYVLAEAEALLDCLEGLSLDLDLDDEAWATELLDARRRREDLEGSALLLRATGQHEAAVGLLADVDREGSLLAESLPERFLPDDERSYRGRLLDPGAWWTEGTPP